jgi:regulator of telomere elongation helicase 1
MRVEIGLAFRGALTVKGAAKTADSSYRVRISESPVDKSDRSKANEPPGRVLQYWCFSAGLAVAELRGLGARSVLFASGTLSPLPAFAAELRLARTTVTLENPHVIDAKKQLLACVVGSGPSGVELKSTYANRSSDGYKDELGRTLDRLARACPKGGILVFFASYGVMEDCVKHWQHSRQGSAWRSLLSAVKGGHVIVEPKTSGDMSQTQAAFDEAIYKHGSAMLLAVCRGKVAEGMDFSDDRCRLVIVTGIPFAPAMDPKIVLKKKFLNDQRRDEAALKKGSSTTVDGITGDDWYAQQAGRAVNQALGRVIRSLRRRFGKSCRILWNASGWEIC